MKQMEEWGEECKITPASRRRQGTRWERPKGGREEEGGGEEETMCADKRRRDRWGGESETGRNRQYFTWCWCQYSANKTLISYMRHKGLHSAFTHLLIQYQQVIVTFALTWSPLTSRIVTTQFGRLDSRSCCSLHDTWWFCWSKRWDVWCCWVPVIKLHCVVFL